MTKESDLKRDLSVVCRCRCVNYKTIKKAIDKGAKTLEDVRRQTRANTGCGQSCTNKIQEMLEEPKKTK
jgi:NAD(P)H-nitrite reductase large subunit